MDLELGIIPVERSKTMEFRNILLNEEMPELLETLPKTFGYVFPNRDGEMFTTIRKGFYAAVSGAS